MRHYRDKGMTIRKGKIKPAGQMQFYRFTSTMAPRFYDGNCDMNFALGQRWISDTESDLGLGTLVGIEGRMLTVLFPACGETRQYAQA